MNNTGPRGGCLFPLGLMALILAAALGACAPRAQAQQPVLPGKQICSNASGSTVCSFQPVTDASPLPVSATASIAGFNQETVLTPFTATTSGVTSGSFTAGKVIVVTNAGTTNMAYCRLGASATTSGQPIAPNGGWFAFTTVAETQVTCATSTSTTTINVGVGTGLPTGTGGGGGGGGGGGAVTMASGAVASSAYAAGSLAAGAGVDGWDLTQGAKADSVCATDTGTCSLVALVKRTNQQVTAGQITVGTAGTPSTQVLSVQGIASMTPIATNQTQVNGSTLSATNPSFAAPIPTTSGGLSVYNVQPTASDNHAVIKAGAGQVYKVDAFNNSAVVNYIRLYNATTGFNGCNSATNIVWQGIIPASTSGAGLSSSWDLGIAFTTGISICVTSGYAQTDTTNATASALIVNVGFK